MAMKMIVALRLECVDRNLSKQRSISVKSKSHSVWSAWIEIRCRIFRMRRDIVALRLECVDRNLEVEREWNSPEVALRLECVDRNIQRRYICRCWVQSHSVWSAWIEILGNRHVEAPINVALRLECVDRNIPCVRCPKVVWVALRLECVDRNVRN